LRSICGDGFHVLNAHRHAHGPASAAESLINSQMHLQLLAPLHVLEGGGHYRYEHVQHNDHHQEHVAHQHQEAHSRNKAVCVQHIQPQGVKAARLHGSVHDPQGWGLPQPAAGSASKQSASIRHACMLQLMATSREPAAHQAAEAPR
jgi:hypothetical protein